uniref:Nudix hydrolase domain-containing protein n=1 Tax=Denticeps clupeoides TaxID=299321 RepID=A0AAY4CXE0_9TELE
SHSSRSDLDLEPVQKVLLGEGLEVKCFHSAPEPVTPVVLRKTACYIVSAVVFNSKNEVLMVQEAKQQCFGRWYLPAGRMEEGESITQALQREVREEAGLEVEPKSLVLVEEQGTQWIRFTFLAAVTGGTLKTEAQADAESLQASWWDRESPLPLRGRDILPLIDVGLQYLKRAPYPALLPVAMPCSVICQRLLLVFTGGRPDNPGADLWILLGSDGDFGRHLPITLAVKRHPVTWAAQRLVQECMPSICNQLYVHTWGILGVQHSAGNGCMAGSTDGICFNTLVSVELAGGGEPAGRPPSVEIQTFTWHRVEDQDLRGLILQRLRGGASLPVHSLY